MKRALFLYLTALFLAFAPPALADPTPGDEVEATDDDSAAPDTLANRPTEIAEAGPPEALAGDDDDSAAPVEVDDLIKGFAQVVDDWKNLGWLAGVVALVNLLILVFRFRPINDALTNLDAKWIKPLIAVILGAVFGGFSAALSGATVPVAILSGVIAGLGSVGFHQLIDQIKTKATG